MRLKGLELQGFKSFADKTKLTFQEGITAIVGPNGSGKSNVSDAIKWVFGEQSVKSLRGAKMEDVIFGGTQGRKQQGYASVAITVDNEDRTIDIDNDVVIITRKLYRNGDSEYRINNNPVRLRDIHQMFMDTGLGRDGYSVIEQGKIAEIISIKSQQRREIFEEAAGISKFRYRKGEAEKRLNQSEENLVRLRDIMVELEERVEPLRLQSEKAKKFLVYMEERKSLELGIWLEKLEKLRIQLKELEGKLLISKGERTTINRELQEIEDKLERYTNKQQQYAIYIDNKRKEIRQLEESLSTAQVDMAVKNNDITHNQESIKDITTQLELGDTGYNKIEDAIKEINQQIAVFGKSCKEMGGEVVSLKDKNITTRNQQMDIDGRVRSLTAQREQIRESKNQALVSRESASTLIDVTVARLNDLTGNNGNNGNNMDGLVQEYNQLEAFIGQLEENIQSLGNGKSGYEYKLSGKQETRLAMDAKLRNGEREVGQKLQKAQLLADMEKNMEGYAGSVKLIMKRSAQGAIQGIAGTVSSLIQVEDKYTTAIEIALGGSLQNIVVKDDAVAKRAIYTLKEANAGRATFLPISSIRGGRGVEDNLSHINGYIATGAQLVTVLPQYKDIVSWLLGRVIIAENMDTALQIGKSCSNRYRIVTLDGQVINAGGSLTGGSSGRSGALLSRKNQIEELQKEAKELSLETAKIEEQIKKINSECATINAMVDGINGEIRTASEDVLVARNEKKRLQMSMDEAKERNDRLAQEITQLSNRVEELKTQSLTSTQLVENLDNNMRQLDTEIVELGRTKDALIATLEGLSTQISTKEIALASIYKDHDLARSRLDGLLSEKNDRNEHILKLTTQRQDLVCKNQEISGQITKIQNLTKHSRTMVEEYNTFITVKQQESQNLEREISQLRKIEKEEISKRELISLEYGRLEERQTSITGETDQISKQMWDEYEVSKTEAVGLALRIDDYVAAGKRLVELKSKIKVMGTVNVAAIDEYALVSERYEFMRDQIADVEHAKSELTRLINQLSSEMSSIFLEKFAEINHHFSDIFTELFGGGKGALTLSEPSNPLESGIDIYVQPPGKIIKSLTSLSGGEQAFVAICIYFAILKVSPAPFVLLDEIEAALDDVNVNRFAVYLKTMAKHTQFIAITHRRGTMEEADVLYGVTMEEEGVSKLLRLDVNELAEKLNL